MMSAGAEFASEAYLLRYIGGWWIGCYNERELAAQVREAHAAGYLTERMHFAPAIPEGVKAWEVTDLGIAHLRAIAGNDMADQALKLREWYRIQARTQKKAARYAGGDSNSVGFASGNLPRE